MELHGNNLVLCFKTGITIAALYFPMILPNWRSGLRVELKVEVDADVAGEGGGGGGDGRGTAVCSVPAIAQCHPFGSQAVSSSSIGMQAEARLDGGKSA